ncbi:carbon-nitrogen hydrolase family protein [Algoriphagus halophilus]|uniref:Carbon-nitrogen hydrolase n=1 Tax=Algoriphagus halophilus TaxID=226505 RepID=A0A1N6EKE0_9BACT|nr:hypothetical protein [Algoriphagus halophilus]SIN83478.1 hypothetical protein SAMN05444394_2251 [Algoriphagus halophilus]
MIKRSFSFLTLLIFIWLIWSYEGRNLPLDPPEPYISVIQEINPNDSLERNIIGIQPYMVPSDYFSPERFKLKIRQYIQAASAKGFIRKNTVILFPEYIGTWLFMIREKHALAEKQTLKEAISTLIFSNVFDYFLGYIKTGDESDKSISAILRMKSRQMAQVYYDTFSELSKETQTHIVAGSIILPGPYVSDEGLSVENQKELYNVSFVFGPDGKILGAPIFETYPNTEELKFITEPELKSVQTFQFPFSKASVIISEDSWYSAPFKQVDSESPDLVLVPSYQLGDGSMEKLWKGYHRRPSPEFVNESDTSQLTNREAYYKYGLPRHLQNTSPSVGLSVFLRGEFWELGTDGQPLAIVNDSSLQVSPAEKAGIWSLNY